MSDVMHGEVPAEVRLPQSFPTRRYAPDGGFSFGGALQLIGTLGLVGIVLGMIASFVSRLFYLVLLFPIAIGCAIGAVGGWGIRRFRIRRPLTCGIAGFLAGVLAMLSMHYGDYRHFEQTLMDEMGPGAPIVREIARNLDSIDVASPETPQEVRELVADMKADPEFVRAMRVDSVWSYIDMAAHHGVEIAGRGGGNGANLGYTGSYIYWIIEALIVAGIAFAMMRTEASQPFCPGCEQWKQAEAWGPVSNPALVAQEIAEGRLDRFTYDPENVPGVAIVTGFRCTGCPDEGEVDVRVEELTVNSKGETKRTQLAQATYPPEAWPVLAAACQPPTLENAPVETVIPAEAVGSAEPAESSEPA